ncbi:MAG: hypothetical protein MUF79_02915 [Burkholderiales bacterium]|nr:hypothetical protein [Burkholderiales bacterium]
MGRVVLIVLIILAVIFLVRGFGRSRVRGSDDDASAARRQLPDQRMVQCAHCGVYVPESSALAAAGLHFCSDEHRRLSGK